MLAEKLNAGTKTAVPPYADENYYAVELWSSLKVTSVSKRTDGMLLLLVFIDWLLRNTWHNVVSLKQPVELIDKARVKT